MTREKISVIVPIYNVGPYLRQCVDSILSQTYSDLEVILVEDRSPDGCGAICDEYAAKDKRVIVRHREKNGGVTAAWNDGMDLATGEWTTFVDADDWLEPTFFEAMLSDNRAADVDVVIGNSYILEWPSYNEVIKHFEEPFYYVDGEGKIRMILLAALGEATGGG